MKPLRVPLLLSLRVLLARWRARPTPAAAEAEASAPAAQPARPVTVAAAQAFLDAGSPALRLWREREALIERAYREILQERSLSRLAARPGLRAEVRAFALKSVAESRARAARELAARMKPLKNPPLNGPN